MIAIGRPSIIIARCRSAAATLFQSALWAIGRRGAGGVGGISGFPDVRRWQVAFGHAIIGIVQPAVPFRGHAAGIVGTIIDHPAPFRAIRPALFRSVIAIALRIGADSFAGHRAVEQSADGGTVPPSEDFCENSHGPAPSGIEGGAASGNRRL